MPKYSGKIFRLIIILTFCFSLMYAQAYAAGYAIKEHEMSMQVPNEFTVLDKSNAAKNKALIEKLGMNAENFVKNLKETGTLIFGVTEDGKKQLNLKFIENDLSKGLYDLTTLTSENQENAYVNLISSLTATGNMSVLSKERVTLGDTLFYKVNVKVSSASGEFCFVQYFSIWNGKFYALVYYNSSPELSEADLKTAEDAFLSLKITRNPKSTAADTSVTIQIILTGVVMLVGIIIVGYIIFTFVRDAKKYRAEKEMSLDRINRKRYK